jgi:Flp pilus assembly pilin Flp
MKQVLRSLWTETDGVLSFEWTLLCVIIVFGIVSGLSAIRDVLIDELGDMAEAVIAFDQSFSFAGIPALGIPPSQFNDPPAVVVDCTRKPGNVGVPGRDDSLDGG